MPSLINIIGIRLGKLTAIKRVAGGRQPRYLFACDCGNKKKISGADVRSGKTTSCGCVRQEVARTRMTVHGHASRAGLTQEYHAWRNMIQRCENKKNSHYKDYGGRGIKVCKRWHKFEAFISDMGLAPTGLTLDRKNNNRSYTPRNCHWATTATQRRNRRGVKLVVHGGAARVLTDWAKQFGIARHILHYRVYVLKLSLAQAISIPVRKIKRKKP